MGKALGIRVTKSTVAKGVSKIIPIVGGIVSGTLNFASMMPMANRLQVTLDKACFDYSDEEFAEDIEVIEQIDENAQPNIDLTFSEKLTKGIKTGSEKLVESVKNGSGRFSRNVKSGVKTVGNGLAGALFRIKAGADNQRKSDIDKTIEAIEKLAQLRDAGVLTEKEFDQKKKELLNM